ncbi:ribonuclease P protein component [Nocardioides sp. Root190]|uniref:ribonuclease P protein component n=1 Tax=Nocardioides sp. Root190 TaxID=1736488 RepID=UPI0006FEC54C|nr:ribonuclease P protein component [Nocardioides sp. Root190]KRB76399.1 ribonuclease P protein component [Nocardioides sp. Root190]
MLDADHRLRDPDSFRAASRRGQRAGSRMIVTHLLLPDEQQVLGVSGNPAQVGFVVSKAVGVAVVRNRVKRRLRHALRERITLLPSGAVLVVRAQPGAATASYPELVAELDRCLQRVGVASERRLEAR